MSTQLQAIENKYSGAHFSDDRRHRYFLWRIWDDRKDFVMFIGLNPSTANESENDPTIRRVISFAKAWGFGGVYMCNLFTFISPYPDDLKKCIDPEKDCDYWLQSVGSMCKKVVFAWGNFKEAAERSKEVIKLFPGAVALEINKNGTPKHPLYIKGDTVPVPFIIHNP